MSAVFCRLRRCLNRLVRIPTSAARCTKILTPRRRTSMRPDRARGRFTGKRKKHKNNFVDRTAREKGERVTLCG